MADFNLPFDLSNYERLDQFALFACQDYNLGNNNDWFGSFRGGLYGFYARIHGLLTHYVTVHAWVPRLRVPSETDYHLASVFFNMDSAVECLTFALNSLGTAVAPQLFRDISDNKALRQISPRDILGNPTILPPQSLVASYKTIFPTVQSLWQNSQQLLTIIVEQHDVSKHRETIYEGGMARMDPPPGFYESLGIPDDPAAHALFWPMAEIILRQDPKSTRVGRQPQTAQESILLESVASDYCGFINKTGECAIQNATANIKLKHTKLITDKQN